MNMGHKDLIKTRFRYTDEDFEDWFKDSKTANFLDKVASHIGWVIINLNELEDIISFCIKELMSDSESGDELIYLFQSELTYSGKVNALIRIYGWHIKYMFEGKLKQKMEDKLDKLQMMLKEAGEIRNQYSHANWHDITANKFVKTRTKAKRDGVYHWFRKFSVTEMKKDLKAIEKALTFLDKFDEDFHYKLQRTTAR
jgi:hypothetical protein